MSIERIYRNLPETVARRLLDEGLIEQPNEIIDSAEGGIRLPEFKNQKEFDEFVERLTLAAGPVAEQLLAEAEEAANRDGGPPLDVTGKGDGEARAARSPDKT